MSSNDYINTINEYIKNTPDHTNGNISEFFNKLFFTYPSTKIDKDKISEITNLISSEFDIPYHDIKVIGSSHIGFSLVKPYNENRIKLFDEDSDIDFAIVNRNLFYKLFTLTLKATKFYTDLTTFNNAHSHKYYINNLPFGFIRPDTIGDKSFRSKWLRFFEDISHDYNIKISAAIYLDEQCFHQRINKAFNMYIERMELNGTK